MTIKEFGGVYLPAHETHLPAWMQKVGHRVDGKLTYQYHKLEAALSHVTSFRRAVDIGAHCGLWSMHLVKKFQRVDAFEPVEVHRQCFHLNVQFGVANLHACALGEENGRVSIHTSETSSGDSWVQGDGEIPLCRLDEVLPDAADVDFIKLDCEGYELFALKGGEQLIRRCKPVICVEQKPGRAEKFGLPTTGAVLWLQGLGYRLRDQISGDYILTVA